MAFTLKKPQETTYLSVWLVHSDSSQMHPQKTFSA